MKYHSYQRQGTSKDFQKYQKKKLKSKINLIPIPLPHRQVPSLPPHAESASEIPYCKKQSLKAAFDLLKSPLTAFLNQTALVDWIVYDYASHWLPPVAAELGISRAFFSLFNAACLAFIGPPCELVNGDSRSTADDFTRVPKWIPFESNIVYRVHEVSKYMERWNDDVIVEPSDSVRFGITVQESQVVLVRSSVEFEPEWFALLRELYEKPVISTGFLPPQLIRDEDDQSDYDDRKWPVIKDWLDKQRVNSVVEGLGFGRVLIMLPELNDQGINSRLLHGKQVGVEIPRNRIDGSFTSDSVAESLRLAMVDEQGELMRVKAKEMIDLFGDSLESVCSGDDK